MAVDGLSRTTCSFRRDLCRSWPLSFEFAQRMRRVRRRPSVKFIDVPAEKGARHDAAVDARSSTEQVANAARTPVR